MPDVRNDERFGRSIPLPNAMYDDDDYDDSEDEVYPRCRACGAEFFDDETVRCPGCGSYQSEEIDPAPRHPGWIIFTAILLVVMSLYWIVKH